MAKRSTEEVNMNMTPMIDIVFQLIIFFVVTVELDRQHFKESIMLAFAPNGPAIVKKDPRTIVIEVDRRGRLYVAQHWMSEQALEANLRQTVNTFGSKNVPVHIRGDREVEHEYVRRIMDLCGRAGIYRVSFVATKEKARLEG